MISIKYKQDYNASVIYCINAELDGIICSGPRRGKQFTYALVDERVPKAKNLSHEKSLASLAKLYFQSHGPAQLKDFVWWSGLSVKDATEGLESIKSQLQEETIEDKTYLFTRKNTSNVSSSAHILSVFDEYTIAYKDRSAISEERDIETVLSMGNAFLSLILINGKLAGAWKRTIKKTTVEIELNYFRNVTKEEKALVQKNISLYGTYLGLTPVII